MIMLDFLIFRICETDTIRPGRTKVNIYSKTTQPPATPLPARPPSVPWTVSPPDRRRLAAATKCALGGGLCRCAGPVHYTDGKGRGATRPAVNGTVPPNPRPRMHGCMGCVYGMLRRKRLV